MTEILTRWAVARETDVAPEDLGQDGWPIRGALERWFGEARRDYLDRCAALSGHLRGEGVRLEESIERLDAMGSLSAGALVLVAVSVTELRPRSFDMALRIRGLGDDGSVAGIGSCRLALLDTASGSRITLPEAVRREILALESAAQHYC